MTEVNLLRDKITAYFEGDIKKAELESACGSLCDDIEEGYSEMEDEKNEAERELKDQIGFAESELEDALETREELLKTEGILPESLTDHDKIDILRLLYHKLSLPKLQQLRDSLGLRPSHIQNPAA